jgi:class 3 adenylate cyclase
MEQQIRFCTSADGTRIAYATYGGGSRTPLVLVHSWAFTQEGAWEQPGIRSFYERLAECRTVVGYDRRGMGASERDISEITLEAEVADLAAVVDKLGLSTFSINAYSAPIAVAYAAANPERVSRLVLWGPGLAGEGARHLATNLVPAIETNWSIARRALTTIVFPSGPSELQRWYSNMLRDSISAKVAAQFVTLEASLDIEPFLAGVRVPTLVAEGRDQPLNSRRVAELLPDARFMVVDGDSGMDFTHPLERARIVEDFLDEELEEQELAKGSKAGLVTILFTDITDSTALTQRLGDAKAQELLRAHNSIVREALRAHGGTEIKHTGDGIMASFPSASGALECAVAIQRAVALRQAQGGDAESLAVHVGINAGEPVAEESDLFGTSVQLARRICDAAGGGQVLVSDVVRQLAAGKGFLFSDRGVVTLKGFEDPVRLWELRWPSEVSEETTA